MGGFLKDYDILIFRAANAFIFDSWIRAYVHIDNYFTNILTSMNEIGPPEGLRKSRLLCKWPSRLYLK